MNNGSRKTSTTTSIAIIAIVIALGMVGSTAVNAFVVSATPAYAAAAAAAQPFTRVEEIPVDETVFVPCAVGGAGEEVHLTGKLHHLVHFMINSTGGVHFKFQSSDQGITGTGLTTGDKYHRTGATNSEFNAKVGEETTVVDSFQVIGQGNGNNFLVHVTLHITVNANGTVTAEVFDFSVECK
jgi:hypothetical protein